MYTFWAVIGCLGDLACVCEPGICNVRVICAAVALGTLGTLALHNTSQQSCCSSASSERQAACYMFCSLPLTTQCWLDCVSVPGTCTCKHTLQQTQCAQRAHGQGKGDRPLVVAVRTAPSLNTYSVSDTTHASPGCDTNC